MACYLGKDVYRLLLNVLDPCTAIKCFQIKFFHDLFSKEERYEICKRAAVINMSKKQLELWENYIEELNKPVTNLKGQGGKNQPQNFINCWLCSTLIHKNDILGHIRRTKPHNYPIKYLTDKSTVYRIPGVFYNNEYVPGIPQQCLRCGTLRPGGKGPHKAIVYNYYTKSMTCPFDIIPCPNRYQILQYSTNLHYLCSHTNTPDLNKWIIQDKPCFYEGNALQVSSHLKHDCAWTCKFCQKVIKGDYRLHFGFEMHNAHHFNNSYDVPNICSIFREPCLYINCSAQLKRDEYVNHQREVNSAHQVVNVDWPVNHNQIYYKYQLIQYEQVLSYNNRIKMMNLLSSQLQQLIIDLSV